MNGTRCSTCYGVIENYSRMPPKFKTETRNLFEKFYPIEIDPHMTEAEKLPHMIQWYDESHELILQVIFHISKPYILIIIYLSVSAT